MDQTKQTLSEGLKAGDLEFLVRSIVNIDTYVSKMGDGKDIIVVSFVCEDSFPAQDLAGYIERGYEAILDADASAGEDEQGKYLVFVEFDRTKKFPKQLFEMLQDISNLVNFEDWAFKYYKSEKTYELSLENLSQIVPLTPDDYDTMLDQSTANLIKEFIGDSLLDDVAVREDRVCFLRNGRQKVFLLTEEDPDAGPIQLDESSLSKIRDLAFFIGASVDIELVNSSFILSRNNRKIVLKPYA